MVEPKGGFQNPEERHLVVPQIDQGDLEALSEVANPYSSVMRMIRRTDERWWQDGLGRIVKETTEIRGIGTWGTRFRERSYYSIGHFLQAHQMVNELHEERSRLPYIRNFLELRKVADNALEASERTDKEIQFYLRYYFPTPVVESESNEFWRAILPQEKTLSILWGALRTTEPVPFQAQGERHQQSNTEDMKLVPPLLPQEMLEERVGKIVSSSTEMRQHLNEAGRLTALLEEEGEFKRKQEEESGDDNRLRFAVRVFNHALTELGNHPTDPQAGIWAIYLRTALSEIRKRLTYNAEELRQSPLVGSFTDFEEFLRNEGWRETFVGILRVRRHFVKPVES